MNNNSTIITFYIAFILFVLYMSLQPSPNAQPVVSTVNQTPSVASPTSTVAPVIPSPTPTAFPALHPGFRVNGGGEGEDE